MKSEIEDKSTNTWESAECIKLRIGEEPFILVTSAIHMSRAMKSYTNQGLQSIAGPADYSYGHEEYQFKWYGWAQTLLPKIEYFRDVHMAIYEYLGSLWYDLRYTLYVPQNAVAQEDD